MTPPHAKPLARALRGPALVGERRQAISRLLEEELFAHAEVLSEGSVQELPAGSSYFGSTMIGFDLARIARHWRGRFDASAQQRFADAVRGSVRMHLRAMRMARDEAAQRVGGRTLGTAQVEVRVRVTEVRLQIDVDVEVPLGVCSGSKTR